MDKNFSLDQLRNVLRQAVELGQGKDFNDVCVNDRDPNRLDIRLGEELSFIRELVLTDGRRVLNMNYNEGTITPTDIVKTFAPFGANQGPAITEDQATDFLMMIYQDIAAQTQN